MLNKIKIVINSHKNSQKALDMLLDSMKESPKFHNYDILIAIGGFYTDYKLEIEENITFIYCNHNSIDFTGLIALNDLYSSEDNTYLYIHDTCKVGPQFYDKLDKLYVTGESMFLWTPSMNMGIYSSNILRQNSQFLESRRNRNDLHTHTFKKEAVELEDYIFKHDITSKIIHSDSGMIRSGPSDVYGTGVLRVTEYYACLDIYKYKANWYVKDVYELHN